MTKSELFKSAHKDAKEIKAASPDLTYRDCFAVALKEAYHAEDSEFLEIAGWFSAKNGIAANVFSKRQIVSTSDKALKIRTAKIWGNGLQIVKEIWVPKSVVNPTTRLTFTDDADGIHSRLPENWEWIVASMSEDCFDFSQKYVKAMARSYC